MPHASPFGLFRHADRWLGLTLGFVLHQPASTSRVAMALRCTVPLVIAYSGNGAGQVAQLATGGTQTASFSVNTTFGLGIHDDLALQELVSLIAHQRAYIDVLLSAKPEVDKDEIDDAPRPERHLMSTFAAIKQLKQDQRHAAALMVPPTGDQNDLGVGVATTLLAGVSFIMCIQYLLNDHDDDIRRYTWEVLCTTVSIFCAVLLFQGVDACVVKLVKGSSKLVFLGVAMSEMFFWCIVLHILLAYFPGKKGYAVLLAHMTGFAAINSFSTLQQFSFFRANVFTAFLVVPIALLGVVITIRVTDFLLEKYAEGGHPLPKHGHEHATEAAMEAENDVISFCLSFLVVQAIRLLISGKLPNAEGEEEEAVLNSHGFVQPLLLFICGLLFLFSSAFVFYEEELLFDESEEGDAYGNIRGQEEADNLASAGLAGFSMEFNQKSRASTHNEIVHELLEEEEEHQHMKEPTRKSTARSSLGRKSVASKRRSSDDSDRQLASAALPGLGSSTDSAKRQAKLDKLKAQRKTLMPVRKSMPMENEADSAFAKVSDSIPKETSDLLAGADEEETDEGEEEAEEEEENPLGFKRMMECMVCFLTMTFGFSCFFSGYWFVASTKLVEDETLKGLVLALGLSLVAFAGIYLLDYMEGEHNTGTAKMTHKVIVQIVNAFAVLIGFSWERCFDQAVEVLALTTSEPAFGKLALAIFCAVLLMPAWRLYMLPMMIHEGYRFGFVVHGHWDVKKIEGAILHLKKALVHMEKHNALHQDSSESD